MRLTKLFISELLQNTSKTKSAIFDKFVLSANQVKIQRSNSWFGSSVNTTGEISLWERLFLRWMSHANHAGTVQSRQCKLPPTQLDLALIVEEDVGTLKGKEGEIKHQHTNIFFYIFIKVFFTHSVIFNWTHTGWKLKKTCTRFIQLHLRIYFYSACSD